MKITLIRLAATLCLASLFSSCTISASAYVERAQSEQGYSMKRGRITRIEGLHTEKIEHLRDGLAITLDQAGEVSMSFENENNALFRLDAGSIIVHGRDADFLLEAGLFPHDTD